MKSSARVDVRRHARRTTRTGMFVIPHAVQQTRGARSHMEDYARLARIEGGSYIGVFDGHGGWQAADYAAKELHRIFRMLLEDGMRADEALTAAFLIVDEDIVKSGTFAGTTATVAYIKGNDLLMANVGDSEAIMVTENGHRLLTELHNPSNYEERVRILQSGGDVVKNRVRGKEGHNTGWVQDLSMTRSLGDQDMKSAGVIAEPTVRTWKINPHDKYLVVASDGIWNYFNTRGEVADVVRNASSPKEAAQELIKLAKLHGKEYADNITVAVVPVKARSGPATVAMYDPRSGRTDYARGGY